MLRVRLSSGPGEGRAVWSLSKVPRLWKEPLTRKGSCLKVLLAMREQAHDGGTFTSF